MLKIESLNKSYGSNLVLEDINLNLQANNIVGLLGPNGSGKTTLIKIIAGLIQDYSGNIYIDNKPIDYTSKAKISYLPEQQTLNEWWTIGTALKFYSDFFANFDVAKFENMLDMFKLEKRMKIKRLSKGMKEKVNLALALSKQADIYLLDEPLGGVDPAARSIILENIIQNYNQNSLLILSTHLISDIEPVLDRAVFIKDRKILLNQETDVIRSEQAMSVNEFFKNTYKRQSYGEV